MFAANLSFFARCGVAGYFYVGKCVSAVPVAKTNNEAHGLSPCCIVLSSLLTLSFLSTLSSFFFHFFPPVFSLSSCIQCCHIIFHIIVLIHLAVIISLAVSVNIASLLTLSSPLWVFGAVPPPFARRGSAASSCPILSRAFVRTAARRTGLWTSLPRTALSWKSPRRRAHPPGSAGDRGAP